MNVRSTTGLHCRHLDWVNFGGASIIEWYNGNHAEDFLQSDLVSISNFLMRQNGSMLWIKAFDLNSSRRFTDSEFLIRRFPPIEAFKAFETRLLQKLLSKFWTSKFEHTKINGTWQAWHEQIINNVWLYSMTTAKAGQTPRWTRNFGARLAGVTWRFEIINGVVIENDSILKHFMCFRSTAF